MRFSREVRVGMFIVVVVGVYFVTVEIEKIVLPVGVLVVSKKLPSVVSESLQLGLSEVPRLLCFRLPFV